MINTLFPIYLTGTIIAIALVVFVLFRKNKFLDEDEKAFIIIGTFAWPFIIIVLIWIRIRNCIQISKKLFKKIIKQ